MCIRDSREPLRLPTRRLAKRGVIVQHPDDYFVELLAAEREDVADVLKEMAAVRTQPRRTVGDILTALERGGLARFAAEARSAGG